MYLKTMKDRRVKYMSFPGVGTTERWVGIRKWRMEENMVDLFCIHI
jgi:hypothetical protein